MLVRFEGADAAGSCFDLATAAVNGCGSSTASAVVDLPTALRKGLMYVIRNPATARDQLLPTRTVHALTAAVAA